MSFPSFALLTLPARLTLLVLGLLAASLLLSGGVLTLSMRHYAQQQAQQATVQALASVVQAGAGLDTADQRLGLWYGQLADAAQRLGTVGALIQPAGQVYRTDLNATQSGQAQTAQALLQTLKLPAETLAEARRRGQAATPQARLIATAGGTVLLLQVPTQDVTALTRRVALTFGGVALATLLLAAWGAAALVRLGLRPLRQMTQQAGDIGEDVTRRLALPAPPDEVRTLAQSLNGMLGRLQEVFTQLRAEEQRTRAFAADASHELRTPIAAISGSLEVLERAGDDPEIRARLSANLRREARRAGRLVDDLLTLTRLDAGEALQLGQVDLAELLWGVSETARDLAPHLEFVLDTTAVTVEGDRTRLEGAVWNLVRNAIAAIPEGQTIILRVRAAGQQAQLSVLNPAQLPAEFLPRMFDRFARGPEAAAGGVGLGLAIVQATARAHGGEAFAIQQSGQLEVGMWLPALKHLSV